MSPVTCLAWLSPPSPPATWASLGFSLSNLLSSLPPWGHSNRYLLSLSPSPFTQLLLTLQVSTEISLSLRSLPTPKARQTPRHPGCPQLCSSMFITLGCFSLFVWPFVWCLSIPPDQVQPEDGLYLLLSCSVPSARHSPGIKYVLNKDVLCNSVHKREKPAVSISTGASMPGEAETTRMEWARTMAHVCCWHPLLQAWEQSFPVLWMQSLLRAPSLHLEQRGPHLLEALTSSFQAGRPMDGQAWGRGDGWGPISVALLQQLHPPRPSPPGIPPWEAVLVGYWVWWLSHLPSPGCHWSCCPSFLDCPVWLSDPPPPV